MKNTNITKELANYNKCSRDEQRAIIKCLRVCNFVDDELSAEELLEEAEYLLDKDYISISTARDGNKYAWYLDEFDTILVNVDTLDYMTARLDDEEDEVNKYIEENFC